MAMTIRGDMAATRALNTLNKNNSQLAKSLHIVASGMKINSAGDDSSAYAISERMRARLRGLNQDIQNVQNGRTLLNVATGGVSGIVEELRSLKELALNAANDTNTDSDRLVLQKEFASRMANIDEIATETNYNGKILLDGRWHRWRTHTTTQTVYETTGGGTIILSEKSGTVTKAGDGFTQNSVQGLFPPGDTRLRYTNVQKWAAGKLGYETPKIGTFTFMEDYYAFPEDGNEYNVYGITLDFSNATLDGKPVQFPYDLHNQGFTLCCNTGCHEFLSITFDANMPKNTAKLLSTPEELVDDWHHVYVVGIKGATTSREVEDSIFNGIKKITDGVDFYQLAGVDDTEDMRELFFDENPDATEEEWEEYYNRVYPYNYLPPYGIDYSERQNVAQIGVDVAHSVQLTKNSDGSYTLSELTWPLWIYSEGVYGNVELTENPQPAALDETIARTFSNDFYDKNPLVIHHGPKANQSVNIYINDMRTDALGLTDVSVTTREKATDAIGKIDAAIEYALDEATNLGAITNRLEYTESNLTTANENTQASESAIRDADMARAMTAYTKNNVLAQASQSMLAQANQNGSAVLSLLQ